VYCNVFNSLLSRHIFYVVIWREVTGQTLFLNKCLPWPICASSLLQPPSPAKGCYPLISCLMPVTACKLYCSYWKDRVANSRVCTDPSPEIKTLRFPGLESHGKRHRSWKTLEKSWNSKVVLKQVLLTREEIHCKTLCATLGQFGFRKTFGLVYCNAVKLITDLVCALFGPHILESPWKRVLWVLEWKTLEFSLCKSWKVLKNSTLLSVWTL